MRVDERVSTDAPSPLDVPSTNRSGANAEPGSLVLRFGDHARVHHKMVGDERCRSVGARKEGTTERAPPLWIQPFCRAPIPGAPGRMTWHLILVRIRRGIVREGCPRSFASEASPSCWDCVPSWFSFRTGSHGWWPRSDRRIRSGRSRKQSRVDPPTRPAQRKFGGLIAR